MSVAIATADEYVLYQWLWMTKVNNLFRIWVDFEVVMVWVTPAGLYSSLLAHGGVPANFLVSPTLSNGFLFSQVAFGMLVQPVTCVCKLLLVSPLEA